MMVHTKNYSGLERRSSERRMSNHRRNLVRYEEKDPRRSGDDRRNISSGVWDKT